MASPTLPVVTGDKDRSLQEALSRLTASRAPLGPGAPTRSSRPRTGCRRSRPRSRRILRAPTPAARRAGGPRRRAALHAPGRSVRARRSAGRNVVTITPTASGKTLCYNAPVLNAILQDPVDARAVSVSDQGARAGPARRAARALGARHARYGRRDRRVHLRRRHAVGRAARDSRQGARRAQQSRHGALGHPAAPSALGEAVREPALRRHRRAARLSRRVRQPPRQHPAPAAARLPALRLGSDLHLLVGDDRQSARARRRADRPSVRAGREERRAARREVLPVRQSAGRQRAARHPPLVSRRSAPRLARVPAATTCS